MTAVVLAAIAFPAWSAEAVAGLGGPALFGIPIDFILFGLTLLGVALFHHHTLRVALAGLAIITLYKLGFTGFKTGAGLAGLGQHMLHEWVILTNLLGLLLGFALLSNHFEKSHVPAVLPRFLPDDWKGAFVLLVMIFVLSSFLDNIAAAMIGGTIAATVFRHKVHIGYLAAIVAASNAGGAGSVVGDTTTTMMWIDGVSPVDVLEAFVASAPKSNEITASAAKPVSTNSNRSFRTRGRGHRGPRWRLSLRRSGGATTIGAGPCPPSVRV